MRRLDLAVAVSILLLISVGSTQQTANISVPNLIRYGGTLKDADGAPITAVVDVTFAIYNQQEGGAPIWMETQNVTTDANGQYSVRRVTPLQFMLEMS